MKLKLWQRILSILICWLITVNGEKYAGLISFFNPRMGFKITEKKIEIFKIGMYL